MKNNKNVNEIVKPDPLVKLTETRPFSITILIVCFLFGSFVVFFNAFAFFRRKEELLQLNSNITPELRALISYYNNLVVLNLLLGILLLVLAVGLYSGYDFFRWMAIILLGILGLVGFIFFIFAQTSDGFFFGVASSLVAAYLFKSQEISEYYQQKPITKTLSSIQNIFTASRKRNDKKRE